jgi:aminopeptidase N
LGSIQDSFTTKSGRQVQLQLYSESKNVHKLHYAMESLQRSMKWDEDRFGLEYDLNLYNIVAVDSFNMGAMENKGLNVFNTAYVLADEKTATDTDFERVEGVIGHEYFHNWTGNRVTCRSWFDLTLKEGLTVFRDQEFSGDMNSKAVNRIENVRGLRARQFAEDAGPMSHPIRPESYISMDNFYTATVYTKGAEVIRMYQTLLTVEGFNKGMELYFQRHDGSAVTCDDFLAAMADANGKDLSQFARWYSTPGTPTVRYSHSFQDGTFTLTLSQESKSTTGPLLIPVSIGLLDKVTGKEVLPTTVLELKELTQTYKFDGLSNPVVPSLLRDFSAPVKIVPESGEVDEDALAFLAARDTDDFNRWEAGQILYTKLIFQTMKGSQSEQTLEHVMDALGRSLADKDSTDFSIQAYTLILPSESTLAEDMEIVDPIGIHIARGDVKKAIARKFAKEIKGLYDELTTAMAAETEFKVDAAAIGRRRLRNVLLEYLCSIRESDEEKQVAADIAVAHFRGASGMTDKMAGLNALASMDGPGASARDAAICQFYDDAEGDALVLNKWFSSQALADLDDVLDRVKQLTKHPDFTLKNPNRCRSLVGAFAMNSAAFHAESGEGYKFLGDILVDLDKLNPQISSRLATNLIQWRRYDEKRAQLMKNELEKLASQKLSDDLFEIVTRGLK